ncbi:MAG: hypothetical protein JSS79_11720 [Bacteroidetes bacterium]|nr:hypothetical protein [Bacteroidota bacterium]
MKTRIFAGLIIYLTFTSCSTKKTDASDQTPDIIKKIAELPEYKREENRIDSLKAKGINVDIQIVIYPDEVHPNDSLSFAYIEENLEFDQEQLYEIKFEKRTQKIISINFLKTKAQPLGVEKIEKVK